jgi:hypothetical protein
MGDRDSHTLILNLLYVTSTDIICVRQCHRERISGDIPVTAALSVPPWRRSYSCQPGLWVSDLLAVLAKLVILTSQSDREYYSVSC